MKISTFIHTLKAIEKSFGDVDIFKEDFNIGFDKTVSEPNLLIADVGHDPLHNTWEVIDPEKNNLFNVNVKTAIVIK